MPLANPKILCYGSIKMQSKTHPIWALLRIALGFILFWAFIDKLIGFGVSTPSEKSWLNGNSPTTGFLKLATYGPFKSIFLSLAGNPIVDWLFMLGLLLIGLALILGIGMKIAAYSGSLLFFLMWLSLFPPKNNPLLDDHIIYILVLIGLEKANAGRVWGLGNWWKNTEIVKKLPFLE